MIRRGRPVRFLYLGDVYPGGSAADFRHHYTPVYGRLRRRTLPTPGNHEWSTHATGYDRYWKRVARGRPPHYYSERVAGWELLSVNSEQSSDPDSRQGRWLARRLARGGTCRIAFWHRPRYSAGLHGDQPDLAPLWKTVAGHVALVVNGHDHDMQAMKPKSRTTEVVAGSGGHGRYPVNRSDHRLAWSDDRHYGGLRIRLRGRRAALAFVAASGRVLRRLSVSCHR